MITRALALAALLTGAASEAAAQDSIVLNIVGVEIEAPMPAGYCLPTGKDKAAADLIAAADNANVSLGLLLRCDADGPIESLGKDYFLFKTPRSTLVARVTRAQLIEGLRAEFGKAEWQSGGAMHKKVYGTASKELALVFDNSLNVSGEFGPRGSDADCAYMGGDLQVKDSKSEYTIQAGACITAIADKVLIVYAYDDSLEQNGIVILMRKARNLAMSFAERKTKTP